MRSEEFDGRAQRWPATALEIQGAVFVSHEAEGGAGRRAAKRDGGLPLSVAKAFQPAFTTTRPGLFADTTVAATNSDGVKGLSFSEMLIAP